jgi:hypothetical protein
MGPHDPKGKCYVAERDFYNVADSTLLALPSRTFVACFRWNGYRRVETLPDHALTQKDGELSLSSLFPGGEVRPKAEAGTNQRGSGFAALPGGKIARDPRTREKT